MRYIIPLLAALALLSGCRDAAQNETTERSRMQHSADRNEVRVDTLRRRSFMRQLISNGRLRAHRRSLLNFRSTGTIDRIDVQNGQRIAAGAVIAQLDRRDAEAKFRQASLALERNRLSFYDELVGMGYPAGDTINVPAELLHVARIRSGYAGAELTYAEAKRDLEGCTLTAPFAGKVADITQQPYDRLKNDFCLLLDDSSLSVEFTVLESEYAFLEPGLAARIIPFGADARELKGRITEINPRIDDRGQVTVRAEVRNDGSLIDGMNVKVIVEQAVPGQLVVPKSAVVIRDNLEVLFLCDEDRRARWTYVRTTMANGDEYAVVPNEERGSELREGDVVITSGNLNLADNSQVTIVKK